MNDEYPNPSEKSRLLTDARQQSLLLYLGIKFGNLNPTLQYLASKIYTNYRMAKFFGIKDCFFNSTKGTIDFVIPGFPKSGTTSLSQYLLQHRKLSSSWIKEPHFFSYGYEKGIDFYLKFFRFHKNSIYFESSSDYLYHPESFKRIKKFNPNMKFIVCLRNPVDQVFSYHNMTFQSGIELDTFEDALSKNDSRKQLHYKRLKENIYTYETQLIDVPYLHYAEYSTHVKKALEIFDYDNFFFIDSNELKTNTQNVLNDVFDFLNLEKIKVNVKLYNTRTYTQKMIPETREKLSKYFEPFNEELENLLNRKFDWN